MTDAPEQPDAVPTDEGASEEERVTPADPSRFRWLPAPAVPAAAILASPLALGGPIGIAATLGIDAATVLVSYAQARSLARHGVTAKRIHDARWVVGATHTVTLRVHNPSDRPLRVTVRDDVPEGFSMQPEEQTITLPPHARRDVSYQIVPPQRGDHQLGDVHLKIESSPNVGAALVQQPASSTMRVYPNVLGPRREELATRVQDLRRNGLRNVRLSGGGGEFAQLREYVQGDAYRDFDWKATAKRQRPITKVREHERSQAIVLAIDAGRMMASALVTAPGPEEPPPPGSATGAVPPGAPRRHLVMTKLDHALNAALLLAHVALRSGDRVGLLVFAEDVRLFVPPGRGLGHYRALLDAVYRVQAELTFVDFRRLSEFVKLRIPKRSLLVVLTDLLDEAHAMPLAQQARVLGKKHLMVCVSLRDPEAERLATEAVTRDEDVWARAAAADLVMERSVVKAHLLKNGVALVEAPASELSLAVVNRYLEIKARARL